MVLPSYHFIRKHINYLTQKMLIGPKKIQNFVEIEFFFIYPKFNSGHFVLLLTVVVFFVYFVFFFVFFVCKLYQTISNQVKAIPKWLNSNQNDLEKGEQNKIIK